MTGRTAPTRRQLLRIGAGAAAVLAAPWLSACGGGEPAPPTPQRFPTGFRWGAATSAYQVEGATTADGRGESVWDRFARTPGRIRGGATAEVAADHYHRWEQDLDLMAELGLTSYRFSLAWPRVQPTGRGAANQPGMDFYRRLVDGCHRRGIAPLAVLHHWDLPQALQETGGWRSRETAQRFADYAELVYAALGDAVPTWLTISDPRSVVNAGHLTGAHAPGLRDEAASVAALHHLLLAHGLAVEAFRASDARGRIGPSLNLSPVYPADGSERARAAAAFGDALENRLYLDPVLKGIYPLEPWEWLVSRNPGVEKLVHGGDLGTVSAPVDLLGVEYYGSRHLDGERRPVRARPASQAGWQQLHPEALYDLLLRLKREYDDPAVVIAQNGIPVIDATTTDGRLVDDERTGFLRDHLLAVHRAIGAGARVEGYHASFLDDFGWEQGYSQRWGLVHVDFDTQRRTPRESFRWYQRVIRENALA